MWSVDGSGRPWKHRRSDPAVVWLRSREDLMCLAIWRPLNTTSVPQGEGLGTDPGQETRARRPGTEAVGGPVSPFPPQPPGDLGSQTQPHTLTHADLGDLVATPHSGCGDNAGSPPWSLNNRGQTRKDQGGEVRTGAGPVGVLPWEAPAPLPSLLFQSQSLFFSISLSLSLSISISLTLFLSLSLTLSLALSQPREGGAHLPTSRNQGNRS